MTKHTQHLVLESATGWNENIAMGESYRITHVLLNGVELHWILAGDIACAVWMLCQLGVSLSRGLSLRVSDRYDAN